MSEEEEEDRGANDGLGELIDEGERYDNVLCSRTRYPPCLYCSQVWCVCVCGSVGEVCACVCVRVFFFPAVVLWPKCFSVWGVWLL